MAKEVKMDCVSIEGDLVSRKGALTGGYNDIRQSKLVFYSQKTELSNQLVAKENDLVQIRESIRTIDAQLNNVLNDLQKHDMRGKRNKDTYELMKSEIDSRKQEIARIE